MDLSRLRFICRIERKIGIEILGSEIKNISVNNDQGLGIRAFKDKASGFVFQMGIDLSRLNIFCRD